MNNYGKRVYYENETGNLIFITPEMQGEDIVQLTPQQDAEFFSPLKYRVAGTYSFIQLEFGQYAQDFRECNGYSVDITGATPTLVFSYPDPSTPTTPPVYQKPLSEQIAELKDELARTNADFTGFQDFYFEKNPTQA